MNNFLIVGAVLLVVGGGAVFLSQRSNLGASPEAAQLAAAFTSDRYAAAPESAAVAPVVQSTSSAPQGAGTITQEKKNYMQAIFKTNMGDITIEFMDTDAPKTVANFTKLASEGFYSGTKFHRVISGFMIQGGDPLTKDDSMQARWGTGDPGYKFADEIHSNNKNMIGTIAMANSGPNTNGSQFFINVANNNFLDSKHTVFGKVVAGMDVVAKIEATETNAGDRPLTPMVIESIELK